jgi:hypothetical protein
VIDYQQLKFAKNSSAKVEVYSCAKTQGGAGSNSSRTNKDEENEFDLSFEEDFFLDLQKGGIDLDE